MLRRTLPLILILISSICVFSQNTDTIQAVKLGSGYMYVSNGKTLNIQNIESMVMNNTEAYQYVKKAKGSASFANVLSYAGGFLIGWNLGGLISGQEINLPTLGIGCGLIAVAIPIASSAGKKLKTGVGIYNQELKQQSFNEKSNYDLKFGMSANGLALTLNF